MQSTPRKSTRCRFIPTCVGNIPSVTESSSILSVHPHVCGEHTMTDASKQNINGSSPRVWGTYEHGNGEGKNFRFIPTCVGNIIPGHGSGAPVPVHPHVCGEHPLAFVSTAFRAGSSPRVWGTFRTKALAAGAARFIPTCVGNIACGRTARSSLPVHPHVCGEHGGGKELARNHPGSSPRVWGTYRIQASRKNGERFIPTCVGNITLDGSHSITASVHPHVCGEHTSRISLIFYSIFKELTFTKKMVSKITDSIHFDDRFPARTKPI